MKKRNLIPVINALYIIQSENLYVVGCAKNIVELKKSAKDLEDTSNILLKRDSDEKWVYGKVNFIKDLVPILDDKKEFIKFEQGKTVLLDDQMAFTLHPNEIKGVIEALNALEDEQVDTEILSKFNPKALEEKENSGWFAKNEGFAIAYNTLQEVGLFI